MKNVLLMLDFIFVAATIGFCLVALAYIAGCKRLQRASTDER
jgi:hypothetical protein